MYAQPQRVDALDRFLGASPYSPYSALSSPTGANMAAAAVQQPPAYGAPGSFAGRKAIQPPGGFSSLSIGDGSNYSPYGAASAAPRYGQGYAAAPSAYLGAQQGGYGSDLSSHLNLQGGAGRRPPSAGRRAVSQPAYGGGYGAAGGYGGGYGGGAGGYGGAAGGYGYGAGSYGADASAYGAYQGASGYGAAGAYSSPYGAAAGGASPYGGLSSPSARSPGAYGGGSAAYGAGAYGASSYGAAGYGSSAYGSAGSYDAYGGASGGGGAARGQGGGSSNYIPSAAYTPTFVPGQKGQFCGKIIQQPPGGKTSINIFG